MAIFTTIFFLVVAALIALCVFIHLTRKKRKQMFRCWFVRFTVEASAED